LFHSPGVTAMHVGLHRKSKNTTLLYWCDDVS